MIRFRQACLGLLLIGLVVGTLSDRAPRRDPVYLGGYRVLAADFHLHSFPTSASMLAPWDLIWEAQRQGLDAVAVSGHNEVWTGQLASWVSRHLGGPTVLASEEIHGPQYHMVAVGIHSTISWRVSASEAIREIHRQGGVAIAAHPTAASWAAFPPEAMRLLDGAEVLQPTAYESRAAARELRAFYARGRMAAIGSSDWRGFGPPGLCRTWVFTHGDSGEEVLRAIREGHTVVYDRGQYFGDPELIPLAAAEPRLTKGNAGAPPGLFSRIPAALGLVGIAVFWRKF